MVKMPFQPLTCFDILNFQQRFEYIDDVRQYCNAPVIIIPTLHPDFSLLFGSIKIIITGSGSMLSHLVILSREQHISVLLAPDIIKKQIVHSGFVIIKDDVITITRN
jgi:phosphoenolpyruvate-protein kinase (PTS system EI component)